MPRRFSVVKGSQKKEFHERLSEWDMHDLQVKAHEMGIGIPHAYDKPGLIQKIAERAEED